MGSSNQWCCQQKGGKRKKLKVVSFVVGNKEANYKLIMETQNWEGSLYMFPYNFITIAFAKDFELLFYRLSS